MKDTEVSSEPDHDCQNDNHEYKFSSGYTAGNSYISVFRCRWCGKSYRESDELDNSLD